MKQLQDRIRALRSITHAIAPDQAWVKATREGILLKVRAGAPLMKAEAPGARTLRGLGELVSGSAGQWIRKPVFAVLSLFILATGGSIMSVSAAEQSMPGDFLYGLKLVAEQARLALTTAKDDRLKLKTEFTGRRVDELQRVAKQKNNEQVVQVAEILKRDLNTLKQQLGEVAKEENSEKAATAARLVDKKSAEVMTALQETKKELEPLTKEKMTEVQSVAADASVKAIEVLAEKHKESQETVPAMEVALAIQEHAKAVSEVTSSTIPFALAESTSTKIGLVPPVPLSEASSTALAASSSAALPGLIDQVKDATTQAFELQKTRDKLETSGSSSTAPIPPNAGSASTTQPLPVTSSTAPAASTTTSSSTASKNSSE